MNADASNPPEGAASRSGGRKLSLLGAVLLAAVVAGAVVLLWPGRRSGSAESAGAGPAGPQAAAAPGWARLVGRWLRPDGGYVLEVRMVASDGKMDAAYYNPQPIHVARAEATREGGRLKVFVELRDVNYPGCTYTLAYEPERDTLQGVYYQAALRESYEVSFVRLPAEER